MEAERRQVTVLFTDMVGFTSFSERSGEEAAFKLMRSLSKLMDDAVREQGGVVQGFTGDGIMAVFGAPVALEDAPVRACRAAVAILQKLKAGEADLETKHGVRPQMRIGLNTGVAVVGSVETGATVLGDAVNVAARLQALAQPDTVFMAETTHRLVQGMVEASFVGEHQIKGKSALQRIYRLNGIRQGLTRFEAALSRGLSAFVGRERELAALEGGLAGARSQLCVIDLVADPGMGKSRLLYEFRKRVGRDKAFFLSGSCSPDGQQTPFLPFIEIIRGSFRISAGELENEIRQKLATGLTALGLHSVRNMGLLLHLLGLNVSEGALTGLDGVLIGMRTRELLVQLLEGRCRHSPVVMLIEDLHWIDSVSEEMLGKIVDSQAKLPLLLLTTRRQEYVPQWLDRTVVTRLRLEPLPSGHIRRLAQARLDVVDLPEELAQQIIDKAGGNPLFAEEIVSFLIERGILRSTTGKLSFDLAAAAAALPASVQNLLTARVDRLSERNRALLQAASVIGRRFDAQLVSAAIGESDDIGDRLTAAQALDLIHPDEKPGDYVFKHALVREALYHSLLSESRTALHLRIADAIEHRSSNRLNEVAEILAHHYSQTNLSDKAFSYLAMAGTKGLSVYSLDEAAKHLGAALALLDKNPTCASDDQVANFLVSYALLSHLTIQLKVMIGTLERYLPRVDRLGDDPRAVLIRHQYVFALLWSTRYREGAAMQQELSSMAERLGDGRSKAYALAVEIHVSTVVAPRPVNEFEVLKREALEALSGVNDAYIQCWTRFAIGWEEMHRGRMTDARYWVRELVQLGNLMNDPRSTGFGCYLAAFVAFVSDSYVEALEYSEQCAMAAVVPFDRAAANQAKGMALVLLGRNEEGDKLLKAQQARCVADGDLYSLGGTTNILAISQILQGNVKRGLRSLEDELLRHEREGNRSNADWCRLQLAEVYLQILSGNEKASLSVLLTNIPTILKVVVTAPARIRAWMTRIFENPHFDPAGHHVGHAQMLLGLLYKARRNPAIAVQHLTEARRILAQFGETPILARLDAALMELQR